MKAGAMRLTFFEIEENLAGSSGSQWKVYLKPVGRDTTGLAPIFYTAFSEAHYC